MKLFSCDLLLNGFSDNHIVIVGFFLMCKLHYVRFIVIAS